MDLVENQIRIIRTKLTLRSKSDLTQYLQDIIKELQENNAPSFVIQAANDALFDIMSTRSEPILLNQIHKWLDRANFETNDEIRQVYAQIGSLVMLLQI